jgi:hypothetical protein
MSSVLSTISKVILSIFLVVLKIEAVTICQMTKPKMTFSQLIEGMLGDVRHSSSIN